MDRFAVCSASELLLTIRPFIIVCSEETRACHVPCGEWASQILFAGSKTLTPRDASVRARLSGCDRPRLAHVQCQPRHHGEQPARRSLVHAGPALQEVRRHGRSSAVLWEAAQGNTAPLQQGLFCTEILICCRRNCLVCRRALSVASAPRCARNMVPGICMVGRYLSAVSQPRYRSSTPPTTDVHTTNAVGGIATRPTAA